PPAAPDTAPGAARLAPARSDPDADSDADRLAHARSDTDADPDADRLAHAGSDTDATADTATPTSPPRQRVGHRLRIAGRAARSQSLRDRVRVYPRLGHLRR